MKLEERLRLVVSIKSAVESAESAHLADVDQLHLVGIHVGPHIGNLKAAGAEVELQGPHGNEGVRVSLRYFGWLIYFDAQTFLQRVTSESFRDDIAILRFRNEGMLFWSSTDKSLLHGSPSAAALVSNVRAYLKLQSFLAKTKEVVSYHNKILREYVILSPKEGMMILGYRSEVPEFSLPLEHSSYYLKLLKLSRAVEFRMFFRDELISQLGPSEGAAARFEELYIRLPRILEAAERDFEVYRTQFSFADLKKKFRAEREMYFSQIRDVSKSLTGQLVAIPISISAAAIAVFTLRTTPLLAMMMVAVYQLYSWYLTFQLSMIRSEGAGILADLNNDIASIQERSIVLSDAFQPEVEKVRVRLRILTRSTNALFVILMCLAEFLLLAFHFAIGADPIFLSLALVYTAVFHPVVYWIFRPSRTQAKQSMGTGRNNRPRPLDSASH